MDAHVLWLGHASALVSFGDERILIDPLGRKRALAVAPYSTILITHAHVDHLNRWTLAKLDKSVKLIVPKGAADVVATLGFSQVLEAEPGDHFSCGSVDVIAVETKHDNGRWKKSDKPICVGYILQRNGVVVHHAGDVDMSTFEVFDEIGRQFEIDATLLPIGGMLPPWYYRRKQQALDRGVHICPETALGIAERLSAIHMVPIHWGTVNLRLFHRAAAPRDHLVEIAESRGVRQLVQVLGHGQALELTRRGDGE
jgi:L-ascorbate metabolism protein UlaG (beta-lactamase superfamily)